MMIRKQMLLQTSYIYIYIFAVAPLIAITKYDDCICIVSVYFSRATSITSESGDELRSPGIVSEEPHTGGKSRRSLFRKKIKKVNFQMN